MKKFFNILLFSAIMGSVSACVKDLSVISPNVPVGSFEDGIEIALRFPDMTSVATRGIEATVPSPYDLDLYLFVFDDGNLLSTIHVDKQTKSESDADDVRKFTAFLPQTDGNAVIHIVAIDDEDGEFAAQIDAIGYGIEDAVMPAFSLTGDKDCYWQRIDLENRIIVTVDNTNDPTLKPVQGTENEISTIFKDPIPLIRNFAKISLSSDVPENTFEILGWTVVNDLDAGSVVPWFSPAGESDIVYPKYTYHNGTNKNAMPDYTDLIGQGYYGVSQTGAQRRNTLDEGKSCDIKENGNDWGTDDRFIYERKYSTSNPLYILLYGKYKGESGVSGGVSGYYKIALAKRDETTGLVTEYNVLRNIAYNIIITDVSAPGYDTPMDAASGPAFNNVSGDVTTRHMTQISDGVDKLYVNFVNYVITQPGHVIDFRYRFETDITRSKTVKNNVVNYKAKGIGIQNGDSDIIKDFGVNESYDEYGKVVVGSSYTDKLSKTVNDEVDGSEWMSVKLKVADPTEELRMQSFTIYTGPGDSGTNTNGQQGLGLSRTINLVLRNPWDYLRMEVFPGLWYNDSEWPDYDPDDELKDRPDVNYYVGSELGAPLTVFWELPAGLPEAMFPLEFQIESDRQNIENAGVGNALVQTGPSLFDGVTDSRISFIKTVTWSDYAPDGESTPASRIIRARFVTTTNINSLQGYDAVVSTVKIHNPYFNDTSDMFERNQDKNVDVLPREKSMSSDPIEWNFSDPEWESILQDIKNGTFTGAYLNGLSITQSNDNYKFITNQNNDDSDKYIASRRSNDQFRFAITFPEATTSSTAVLKFVAEKDSNSNTTVNLTTSFSPNVQYTVNENENAAFVYGTKKERVYTLTIPPNATTLTVTLSPGSNYNNATAIRIYKIVFYPLGEPQSEETTP